MSKAKLGFGVFTDGYYVTDIIAPKSLYPTKEDFIAECEAEYKEGYDDWFDKVKIENVQEAHCRYFPNGLEGFDWDGGCYGLGKAGSGAFPVWRIPLQK